MKNKNVINHFPILEYSIISTSHKASPPSKLNRARQIPANRLQLQMRLVAWVAQPLRPLGTSPPAMTRVTMRLISGGTLELKYLARIDLRMLTKIGNASGV